MSTILNGPGKIDGPILGAVAIEQANSLTCTIQFGDSGEPQLITGRDVWLAPKDGWDSITLAGPCSARVWRYPFEKGDRPAARGNLSLALSTDNGNELDGTRPAVQLVAGTEWTDNPNTVATTHALRTTPGGALLLGAVNNSDPTLGLELQIDPFKAGLLVKAVTPAPADSSLQNQPAPATKATISVGAAGGVVRNVTEGGTASIATNGTVQTPVHVNLRDGATGAGAILWSAVLAAPINGCASVDVPAGIKGSGNTAMTLEFEAAGVAASVQDVSLLTSTST